MVPIPGTRRVKYLEENLGAVDVKVCVWGGGGGGVGGARAGRRGLLRPPFRPRLGLLRAAAPTSPMMQLSAEDMTELLAIMESHEVAGMRYPEAHMKSTFHYGKEQQQQAAA